MIGASLIPSQQSHGNHRARVAFGSFFVVQVRDSNFASVPFDHDFKQFFVVRNSAGTVCRRKKRLRHFGCIFGDLFVVGKPDTLLNSLH